VVTYIIAVLNRSKLMLTKTSNSADVLDIRESIKQEQLTLGCLYLARLGALRDTHHGSHAGIAGYVLALGEVPR
jgi:hypothetical protein